MNQVVEMVAVYLPLIVEVVATFVIKGIIKKIKVDDIQKIQEDIKLIKRNQKFIEEKIDTLNGSCKKAIRYGKGIKEDNKD